MSSSGFPSQTFGIMSCRGFSKVWPKSLYYSTWYFVENVKERILNFYNFFSIHIHVLMLLCRKFELIQIKIGFLRIFKVASKSGQSPCTIVQGLWPILPKSDSERILLFIFFSDTYTVHVVMLHRKFELVPIKIGFLMNFKSCFELMLFSLLSMLCGKPWFVWYMRNN